MCAQFQCEMFMNCNKNFIAIYKEKKQKQKEKKEI